MCGIYGQIATRRARRESGLAIRHRGPDDSGTENFAIAGTDLCVSLIHRRLAIVDLSRAGHQPMANEDETVWVAFNGEIYNFMELRSELSAAGHHFRSRTDTETIIHGYETWGDDVVSHLGGMFAFAIWDASRKRLLLARDRVGKKPLFYHAAPGGFFFGSEIKSLLASGEIQAVPNASAIDNYLTYLYFPGTQTAFEGIAKLSPATTLTVEIDGAGELRCSQRTFWDPLDVAGSARAPSLTTAVEQTRELIDQAVRIRLMSDVPLGILLSGGLDSGAITAFAAKHSDVPVRTFSIGFRDHKRFDETSVANQVAQRFATNHRVLEVDARVAEHMATVVRHFDEPFGNPTAILEYILTKHMREFITVALSGDGGDEAFGGYVRYGGAWVAQKYRMLPSFLTGHLLSGLSRLLHDDTQGRHSYRRLREFLESAWMPQEEMYLRWVGYFSLDEKRDLYTPEFASQVEEQDSGDFLRQLFRRAHALDPLNRLGYVDSASFLVGNCLEYADRMSMANSMEIRCPFTDHRIVEFGLSMPFEWKFRTGKTKWLLRRALEGILPDSVLRMKKIGFNPPISEWLVSELRPVLATLLSPEAVRRRGVFRPPAIARLLRDHFEGKRDNGLKIWALLMLEIWFRIYIDHEECAEMAGKALRYTHESLAVN